MLESFLGQSCVDNRLEEKAHYGSSEACLWIDLIDCQGLGTYIIPLDQSPFSHQLPLTTRYYSIRWSRSNVLMPRETVSRNTNIKCTG
jgi:hypothetical protein